MIKSISLPAQLLIVILAAVSVSSLVSLEFVRAAYTFSVIFKDVLAFFLPFVVFAFILGAIVSFEKNASKVLSILLGLIFVYNISAACVAYTIGTFFLSRGNWNMNIQDLVLNTQVEPFFRFTIPNLVRPEWALIAAIILGIICSFIQNKKIENKIIKFKDIVENSLTALLIPLLPLYIFGFLLKISYEGTFVTLFQNYGKAFLLLIGSQTIYLIWMYSISNGFNLKKIISTIKNMLPAYITAFSTMSSAATIPVSIDGAYQNTHNKKLSNLAMPIMANVHLLGASFSTPLLSLVTLKLFTGAIPDFSLYIKFIFYFGTSMFAVSGIPGGGILVVTPILISMLGFNSDMIDVITTLYMLQDPFGTAANIMGDGALVLVVNKILKKLRIA